MMLNIYEWKNKGFPLKGRKHHQVFHIESDSYDVKQRSKVLRK